MPRRVVISGLGAVSCLGLGFSPLWEALVAGRSGLAPITRLDASEFRCRIGGEVKEFSARDLVPKSYRKAVKVMARDIELAVAAAKFAVEDAGVVTKAVAEDSPRPLTYPPERMGCQIGAGLIAAETQELTYALASSLDEQGRFSLRRWGTVDPGDGGPPVGGMQNLQPLWLLKYLPNMLACHVTIIHQAEGPSNTITCGEASGLLSIGEGARVIQRNAADLCFSGGAESKLNLMGMLRQQLAGRLADSGDAIDSSPVRPFDPSGTGTAIGEGGAIVILEEETHARERGAKVYALVAGFGAAHSTGEIIPPLAAPAHDAFNDGLELAVRAALRDAAVGPEEIDAIVPQAAGVPAWDLPEAGTLRRIFGERLARIPIVPLAPFIGDCAAGSGIAAAVGAMMCRHQRIPARLHAGKPLQGLDAGPAPSAAANLRHVLVCSGSMGGQNAAVVLRRVG